MEDKIEVPMEDLKKVTEIMGAVQSDLKSVKENMMSKEAFEKRGEELVTKAVEESKKAAAKEQERKALITLSQMVVDPCVRTLQKALKIQDKSQRNERVQEALSRPSANPDINAFKEVSDDLYLVDTIMRNARDYQRQGGVESLDTYRRFKELQRAIVKTATDVSPMDTADTAYWVPTGMSSQVIDLPIIYGAIEPLFQHIYCPTKTYTYPLNLSGPDQIADNIPEATTGVTDPGDTMGQVMVDGTLSFTAAKLRSRLLTSVELTEDAIMDLIPVMKAQLKKVLDQTVENCILNGDTTATHFDTDIEAISAYDGRTAWKGLRRLTIGVSGLNGDLSATWAEAHLRTIHGYLGKFGTRPSELAYIVGPKTYVNKMLGLESVITVDKYGPAATVLTGELSKFDGIPVIISEYQREDVGVDGFNAASGNTYTTIILVNHRYFYVGDRRLITLATDPWPTTEQLNLLAFRRLDFKPFQTPSATYPLAGIGFKITP
jgi:HK97 family phage major capsid protein